MVGQLLLTECSLILRAQKSPAEPQPPSGATQPPQAHALSIISASRHPPCTPTELELQPSSHEFGRQPPAPTGLPAVQARARWGIGSVPPLPIILLVHIPCLSCVVGEGRGREGGRNSQLLPSPPRVWLRICDKIRNAEKVT